MNALLEDNLREIERIVEGIDEQRAGEGPWPMREILSHLAGAQDLMFARARRMVEEDDPSLGSVQPSTVGASEERNLEYILEQFHATRMELLGWFRSLSDVELARTGQHPEWGPFTVLSQVSYMVQHEQLHLAEFEARRDGR